MTGVCDNDCRIMRRALQVDVLPNEMRRRQLQPPVRQHGVHCFVASDGQKRVGFVEGLRLKGRPRNSAPWQMPKHSPKNTDAPHDEASCL